MRFAIMLGLALISVWAVADDDTAVTAGQAIYSQTCIACHGANGKGAIPGVADLTKGDGALSKPDETLLNSITEGFQSPGSALAMPPNGGNPTLAEEDVKAVLAYLRAAFGRSG
ncbi:MAG: c-type cytochrome [Gammaproteobacteria bacterium]|nr:c-type cytochrome [Gammaproteobacteria bacterium]